MPYDSLQKGRRSLPLHAYFITTVTNGRNPLLKEFSVARLLIGEMRSLHDTGYVLSLAWVVMPDHLHWLLQLGADWSLARVMKTLKARSAFAINRHQRRRGSFWQRAYYEHAIRSDEDIRQLARYIVANPLRAGLVERIGDYPHWDCVWVDN